MNQPTQPTQPTQPSQKATHLAERPQEAYARTSPPLRFAAWTCSLVVFGAPLGQVVYELMGGKPVQALDYLRPFSHGPGDRPIGRWVADLADDATSAPRLREFEQGLHEASFITRAVLPWYQSFLTRLFGQGNNKAVTGRDGWLFFADDLTSAYGRGYLTPYPTRRVQRITRDEVQQFIPGASEGLIDLATRHLDTSSVTEIDSGGSAALAAIADCKAQLDARGIKLLLVPSYSKEMLDADRLSRFSADLQSAVNPDLERFYDELTRRGIDFVRMDELFAQCRAQMKDPGEPLALPRDTHWSPATMAFCAAKIAERARARLGEGGATPTARFEKRSAAITGKGDLVRMLGLPEGQTLYPPMELTIETVVDRATGELVRSDPKSDVLEMGDSLTKVFSDPTLGLGEGAGLAEHLALHLTRPLDVIAIPGKSASGTRDVVARREGDGLAGKRLVIWQFGVRMLASGPDEWRLVELPTPGSGAADGEHHANGGNASGASGRVGQPIGTKGRWSDEIRTPDYEPPESVPKERVKVVGEITAVSRIPGNFDYSNTLVMHEFRVVRVVDGALSPKLKSDRIWVAFPGRIDDEDLPMSLFEVGRRMEMVLEDHRLRFDENVSIQEEMDAGRIIYYPLVWNDAQQ